MQSKDELLIDIWEGCSAEERRQFLLELNKRYNFGRLCVSLLGKEYCWLYKQVKGMTKIETL